MRELVKFIDISVTLRMVLHLRNDFFRTSQGLAGEN